MLRIQGNPRTLCDGLTRRDLLQVGALGPLGIGLGDVMAAESQSPGLGSAKSCILLFPYGSPPTHETFDPKPDAGRDPGRTGIDRIEPAGAEGL